MRAGTGQKKHKITLIQFRIVDLTILGMLAAPGIIDDVFHQIGAQLLTRNKSIGVPVRIAFKYTLEKYGLKN